MCLELLDMNVSFNFVQQNINRLGKVSKSLFCVVLGAASALALPPFDAWWIFGFTVPAFLFLIDGQPLGRSFQFGWLFGFGYFLVALHWIGYAFFVNAAADLWMMPFAVGGLSAAMALYWAAAAGCASTLCKRGWPIYFAMPICLAIAEWLRGRLFTGFPWAVPGQAVDGMGGVAQAASIIGMNGLTFILLLCAAAPFALFKGAYKTAFCMLAILPLMWLWGEWRLHHNPTQFVDGVQLRIVQPNLSQDDKWRNGNARLIFDELLALSALPSQNNRPITHIIWPESIVPFLIDESPQGLSEIAAMLGSNRYLLAGAVRRAAPANDAAYYTSILAINGNGQVIGHYDKSHLVPGGEFLPFAWLLEPLGFRQVVDMPESFSSGTGTESLAIPGAGLVGAQICYEAIFPEQTSLLTHRPDWLVNVTNDGWFGKSTGPWQHLAQLRLRAIEQGLAVARAANTGISAVIDPYGRYIFQSEIGVKGQFDSSLPRSIEAPLYARIGDYSFMFLLFCAIVFNLVLAKRHKLSS